MNKNVINNLSRIIATVVIAVVLVVPFLYSPYRHSTNPVNTGLQLVILFIMILASYAVYKQFADVVLKDRVNVLNSKLLLGGAILVMSAVAALVSHSVDSYQNLFSADNPLLYLLLAPVIGILLAHVFVEYKFYRNLLVFSLVTYIVASVVVFGILLANVYSDLKLPDVTAAKTMIITNLILVSVLVVGITPVVVKNFTKNPQDMDSLLISLFMVAVPGLFLVIFFSINVAVLLILVVAAGYLMMKEAQKNPYAYGVVVVAVLVVGFAGSSITPKFDEIRDKLNYQRQASIVDTIEVVANSTLDGKKVLSGSGYRPFNQSFLQYQPKNNSGSEVDTNLQAFGLVAELFVNYGLIILIGLAIFILYAAKSIEYLQLASGKTDDGYVLGIVKILFAVFIASLLVFNISLQFMLVFAVSMAIWSHFEAKDYLSLKKDKASFAIALVGIVSMLLAIVGIGGWYTYKNMKVIRADFVYANAYYRLYTNDINKVQISTIASIRNARKIDPEQPLYREDLAKIYAAIATVEYQNGVTSGEDNFRRLVNSVALESEKSTDLSPENYFLWKSRFEVMRLMADFIDTKEVTDKAAKKMQELAPNNSKNLIDLANYYKESDTSKNYELIEKAYNYNPNMESVQLEYAGSLRRQGKFDEATQILLKLTEDEDRAGSESYQKAVTMLKEIVEQQKQIKEYTPKDDTKESTKKTDQKTAK